MFERRFAVVAVTTGALTAIFGAAFYLYTRRLPRSAWSKKGDKPRGNWRRVGTLSHLNIYPLKSGQKVSVEEGMATKQGLVVKGEDGAMDVGDRRFVVYKEDTKTFVTARTYPNLMSISLSIDSNDVVHLRSGDNQIRFMLPKGAPTNTITMWHDEKLPTEDCGRDAARWISQFIYGKDEGLRIGYWGPHVAVKRDIREAFKRYFEVYPNISNDFTGIYSDIAAFHLINMASIEELNRRIDKSQISPQNFRPNLVIETDQAFGEDEWEWIKIGDEVVFRNFIPCFRCIMTTIDPEDLTRSKAQDPLKTLKTFRTYEDTKAMNTGSPNFGVHLGLFQEGSVRVGDSVYISD